MKQLDLRINRSTLEKNVHFIYSKKSTQVLLIAILNFFDIEHKIINDKKIIIKTRSYKQFSKLNRFLCKGFHVTHEFESILPRYFNGNIATTHVNSVLELNVWLENYIVINVTKNQLGDLYTIQYYDILDKFTYINLYKNNNYFILWE